MKTIAFTGGGTGGHIYPGLAVAEELKKQLSGHEIRLFWIGSSAGMDRALVEEAGIEFFGVPSGKLRRYFSLKNIIDLFKVIAGFFAAKKILKKQKASILFSKGGFVSVPPCAAASSLGIPVFTHESDYSPGLATKINIRFVMKTGGRVFTAYEDTKNYFPKKLLQQGLINRITTSGNPVRSIFNNADAAIGRSFLGLSESDKNTPILLILGGSQGALEINELVRSALPALTKMYIVVHQTGPKMQWDISASPRYKPFAYIKEEMPHVMAAAELIMGRSGAGIWEWAFLGKPMLLIPLKGSGTRGDQVENADYFQKAGAAQVLFLSSDIENNVQIIINAVDSFVNDSGKRDTYAAASLKIGKCGGAIQIAGVLSEALLQGGVK